MVWLSKLWGEGGVHKGLEDSSPFVSDEEGSLLWLNGRILDASDVCPNRSNSGTGGLPLMRL